jgi:hypothetical protein
MRRIGSQSRNRKQAGKQDNRERSGDRHGRGLRARR